MKRKVFSLLFCFALLLASWGQSLPGSGSEPQGSKSSGSGPLAQSRGSKNANALLSDLGELLETLRAENENSIPLSETRIEALTMLAGKLSTEIEKLKLSVGSLSDVKQLYAGLSETLGRLSMEFVQIQTKNENLTTAYDSLLISFEKFKESLDNDIATAKAEAVAARNTSKISFIASGISIGAAAGFIIGGPIGAAIGGSIGGVFAFVLRPG